MSKGRKESYTDKLIASLSHPDPVTRRRAAWVLGERRDREAVEPLVAALDANRDDPYILESIVEALGKIGDQRAAGVIAGLLLTSYLVVRVRAAESLGRLGGPRAAASLRKALRDANRAVREAAEKALQKLAALEKQE